jgi:hypothetical protein
VPTPFNVIFKASITTFPEKLPSLRILIGWQIASDAYALRAPNRRRRKTEFTQIPKSP